jgi:hypothetical protein
MAKTALEIISALPMVAKVSAWNDRVYVNLLGFDSAAHGDRTRKIWIKGDMLTIERGKGNCSGRFATSCAQFLDALAALGATTDKPFAEASTAACYKLANLKQEG